MTTDQRRPGTDDAGQRPQGGAAARPTTTRQALREIRGGVVAMWWGFFDWVAVVPWKTLLLVSFLGLILAGMLQHPTPVLMLIIAAVIGDAVNYWLGARLGPNGRHQHDARVLE